MLAAPVGAGFANEGGPRRARIYEEVWSAWLDEISDVFVQFRHPDQELCDKFARERQMILDCASNAAHNASQLIKADMRVKKGHVNFIFLL